MRRFLVSLGRVLGIATAVIVSSHSVNAAQVPPKLLPLLQAKEQIALALSEPAARCVQRQDTMHAAFHGCIDWHSAVHGTWSLVAYTAMTGDKRYEPIINEIISSKNLDIEQGLLVNNPTFEMPYGRAWFLRLALEYERHYQNATVQPMADFIASTITEYYEKNPPDPLSVEYKNSAWALINLLDYYEFRGQNNNSQLVKELIKSSFLSTNLKCESERDRPGFMAICTNWAWLASKVMERNQFDKWISNFLPPSRLSLPIDDPKVAHEYGLNFSRAWGLWELYSITTKPEYIDSYVDHVQTTLKNRNNWDRDYQSVGHWVPQFGMFAIQPLFGQEFR